MSNNVVQWPFRLSKVRFRRLFALFRSQSERFEFENMNRKITKSHSIINMNYFEERNSKRSADVRELTNWYYCIEPKKKMNTKKSRLKNEEHEPESLDFVQYIPPKGRKKLSILILLIYFN
jgi:hypothetical protein